MKLTILPLPVPPAPIAAKTRFAENKLDLELTRKLDRGNVINAVEV